MTTSNNIFSTIINELEANAEFRKVDEKTRNKLYRKIQEARKQDLNILLVGATGVGKSSTINALFGERKAKVGYGVDPETMELAKYEFNNIVLYDSPGLGDGRQKDIEHARKITDLLHKKDKNGDLVIDLVLVLLDGSSRDYGTAYELINSVILPSLGEDHSRLLIAINKADMAMKRRYWTKDSYPQKELIDFLDEKVSSTKRRIKEATDVDVDVIYYSAGYSDKDFKEDPYNLAKLLSFILKHTKESKRVLYAKEINQEEEMWRNNDDLEDYQDEVKESIFQSVASLVNEVADGIEELGTMAKDLAEAVVSKTVDGIKATVNAVGRGVASVVSGIGSAIGGTISSIGSFFGSFW